MSATTPPVVPTDPAGVATPAEFASRLRALMKARRRSLDTMVQHCREAHTPISRATVHNLITARGVPRRESLLGFLRGCGLPPQEQFRWLITFDKVYSHDRRAVAPLAAPQRRGH